MIRAGAPGVIGILCFLLAAPVSGADWGVSKAVPPFDAFWEARPKGDMNTLILWQFDDEASGTEDVLDQLDDITKPSADDQSGALGKTEDVRPQLKGDAAQAKDGRFGGCVKLSGKGYVEGTCSLSPVLRDGKAATLDFWVWPDKTAADAVLLFVPCRGNHDSLSVKRTPQGRILLSAGKTVALESPRQAPDGCWTHVAVTLFNGGTVSLLVNGTPAVSKGEDRKALEPFLDDLWNKIQIGAGADGEAGFPGRIDAVRVVRFEHLFYELADDRLLDPKAERPLTVGPPWFAKKLALPLSCPFDGTVQPDEFTGVKVEGKAAEKDFRPGVRGKALDLTRAATNGLSFNGYAVLPLKQGTLEFWFRPLDWNNFFHGDYLGMDVPWLTLFRFAPKGCESWRGLRALRIAQGRNHRDYFGGTPWVQFQPGRWTHVVCAWDESGIRIYLDGEPQQTGQVAWAGPLHIFDTQEHEKWLKESGGKDDGSYRITFSPSHTMVDEFRIYPYALAPEEAKNAYARFCPDARTRMAELPYIRVDCGYDYYGSNLTARVSCLPVAGVDPATAVVRITAPDSKTVVLDNGQVPLDASLRGTASASAELGFGRFAIEAESKSADGKTLKALKTEYVREKPAWWQNTLGKERVVPKPWTPIKADGTSLSVWGRVFKLDKSGLPASILSAGAETLAGAPTLRAVVEGGEDVAAGQEVKIVSVADDRAEWTGTASGKGIKAQVRGTLEYDGLLGLTVSVKPAGGQPVEIKSLTLDFPLRSETAQQLIVNGGGANFRAAWDVRMLPGGTGRVWDSKTSKPSMEKGVAVGHFCPVIWIGDDDRGLCFFGENDRGWTPDQDNPAQELVRDGDRVIYRMNIFTKPVRLEKPREFAFFIHPTPTKPLPPLWRTYNRHVPGMPMANYEVIDVFAGFALTASPDRPTADISFQIEPLGWEEAAAQREQLQAKFGKENPVLMYIDYSWPKMGPTMDDYRHSLWAGAGRMTWTREGEDYFVYWMNEYFKRGLIEGIYIDDTSLGRTFALYSTAYRLDDGKIQPGFVTMGFRRFLQRMWVLFDQQGKRARICPHMTWCFEVPALSFADATVNGEDRDIIFPAQHRYMDTWGRDELRVMGSSEKWGSVALWKSGLDYLKAPKSADTGSWSYWQSRTMFAHLTPHGFAPMWADAGHGVFAASLQAFGVDDPDLRFIPDWKLDGTATVTSTNAATDPKETLVCFYLKKDRALMMVSNYAKEDRGLTVTVDPQKLFGRAGELAFKDADLALKAPAARAASAKELKEAEEKMKSADLLDTLDKKTAGFDVDVDNLEGKDPAVREAERLALHPDGNAVKMVVRKQDFRLIEVRAGK